MGCGASAPGSVAPSTGFGLGSVPAYPGLQRTKAADVAILWDMDDVPCPYDAHTARLFIDAVRKVFVNDLQRRELSFTAIYDARSVLNSSPDVQRFRTFVQQLGVQLHAATASTTEDLGQKIRDSKSASSAKRFVVVVVGGVADYHEECALARKERTYIERLYSKMAMKSMVQGSNANWYSSVADFLAKQNIKDWRTKDSVAPAIKFDYNAAELRTRLPQKTESNVASLMDENYVPTVIRYSSKMPAFSPSESGNEHPKMAAPTAAQVTEKAFRAAERPEQASSGALEAPAADACKTRDAECCDVPEKPEEDEDEATSAPVTEATAKGEEGCDGASGTAWRPQEDGSQDYHSAQQGSSDHSQKVTIAAEPVTEVSAEDSDVIADTGGAAEPAADASDFGVAQASEAGRSLEPSVGRRTRERVAFSVQSLRAQEEEAQAKAEEVDRAVNRALDSFHQESIDNGNDMIGQSRSRSSARSATMGRRRSYMPVMDDAETEKMIRLMDQSLDAEHSGGEAPFCTDEDSAEPQEEPSAATTIAPDPVMVWKADVLRTLRGLDDQAITVETLANVVALPLELLEVGYCDALKQHVVKPTLVRWVVENESIQVDA